MKSRTLETHSLVLGLSRPSALGPKYPILLVLVSEWCTYQKSLSEKDGDGVWWTAPGSKMQDSHPMWAERQKQHRDTPGSSWNAGTWPWSQWSIGTTGPVLPAYTNKTLLSYLVASSISRQQSYVLSERKMSTSSCLAFGNSFTQPISTRSVSDCLTCPICLFREVSFWIHPLIGIHMHIQQEWPRLFAYFVCHEPAFGQSELSQLDRVSLQLLELYFFRHFTKIYSGIC